MNARIMNSSPSIQAIRRFNRLYTQTIGVLDDHYLQSPYSLTELRILHELFATPGITAKELATRLAMDHGFLSRALGGLERKKRVTRTRSKTDKRAFALTLTSEALAEHPALDAAANASAAKLLAAVEPSKQAAFIAAMETIARSLTPVPESAPLVFRQLGAGDAGWIVHRHGAVIAHEFGWNMEFEALCAKILSDFITNYQPEYERSWIVEREGGILGSLFLVRQDETTAKLRLLYIEQAARGLGLATKLLEKSFAFARSKHYQRITLFTTSGNVNARRIYEKLGMQLTKEEPLEFAGQPLIGETWERDL